MKIFHLTSNSSAFTGGARQLIELGNYQKTEGHTVFYGFRKIIENPYSDIVKKLCGMNLEFFKQPGEEGELKSYLKALSPDIMHVHCKAYRNFVNDKALLEFCPIIVNIGHSEKFSRKELVVFEHRNIKKIVCVSDSIKDELSKVIKSSCFSKLTRIYSATDLDKFFPQSKNRKVLRKFKINSDIIIGTVGSLYKYKGYHCLLSAFKKMMSKHKNMDVTLVIVGKAKTEHGARVKNLVENDTELNGKVIFPDGQENIPEFMSTFSMLVSSSASHEGLSGVIREAMAMKIPVICTDIAGNCEIAKHLKTAFIVPPNDPDKLFCAMINCIRMLNSLTLRKMTEAAYKEVANNFNFEQKSQIIDNLYFECVAQC